MAALDLEDLEMGALMADIYDRVCGLREQVQILEACVEKNGAKGVSLPLLAHSRQQLMIITARLNMAFVGIEQGLLKRRGATEH